MKKNKKSRQREAKSTSKQTKLPMDEKTKTTILLLGIGFIICAGVGLFFVGKYVIRNLASQMTDARPCDGFVVLISQGLIMMTATLFALPISHSHVLVFCIIGLSLAQKKQIDKKVFFKMTTYWLLTFPISALLAGFIYFGFISFGYL